MYSRIIAEKAPLINSVIGRGVPDFRTHGTTRSDFRGVSGSETISGHAILESRADRARSSRSQLRRASMELRRRERAFRLAELGETT